MVRPGQAILPALAAQTLNTPQGVGTSGSAALTGQFLTLATDAGLTVERVFTPGDGLVATDNGAGATYDLVVSPTVARSSWPVIAGAGLTGGGNLSAAGITLDVGAGSGISVTANTVAVDGTVVRTSRLVSTGSGLSGGGDLSADRTLAVDATVARNTWPVTAGAGLTGGGNLAAAGITLDVGAGNGILANANDVAVNQGFGFAWTGPQTWAGTATFNGVASFTANIGSHLIPNLTDTYQLGSSTKLWAKGWLSELDAILFAQNVISVIGGWLLVSKGEGTAQADIPAAAGPSVIDLGATGTIAVNDFILFRAAGLVEYMQVTAVSGGGTSTTVTRDLDGTGANAWPAGSVFVNLGYNGTGRIELNAASSAPQVTIIKQGTAYNAQTEIARLGDLNGAWGYGSTTPGLALGEYAASLPNITVDSTNGLRIRIFNGTPVLQLDTSGNADITGKLRLPGASSALAIGATPPTSASAGTGLWLDRTGLYSLLAGTYQVKIDAVTGALLAGTGNVRMNASGIQIAGSSVVVGFYDSNTFTNLIGGLSHYTASGNTNVGMYSQGIAGSTQGEVYLQAANAGLTAGASFELIALGGASTHSYANLNKGAGTFDGLTVIDSNVLTPPNAMLDVRGDGIVTGGLNVGTATGAGTGSIKGSGGISMLDASAFGSLGTLDGIVLTANLMDGQIYARSTDASSIIQWHIRPSPGKGGWLTYTEDSVADRWAIGLDAGSPLLRFRSTTPTGTDRATLDTSGNLNVTGSLQRSGTQVVGAQRTGYTNAWTGTLERAAARDASTISLAQLAQRVAAIQLDLTAHGLIG